jgi:GDP-L-fucose synthase
MAGSAIVRRLRAEGFQNIVTRSSKELDLRQQRDVNEFFANEKPDYIFMAAARVGGILANNTYRAEFLYDKKAELITYHRGHLTIVDRGRLEAASCECYRATTNLLETAARPNPE